MTLRSFRRGYERFLEWICIALMAALAAEVTAGVVFRYSGHSLVWYDEVATILLAWVTFYGSALAVLKHAHMGVPEIVRMLPPGPRVAAAVLAQLCTMAFFVLLAWVGYSILEILAADQLVSLPQVSVAYAMSAIPIGAVLFVVGQLLVFPEVLREARGEASRSRGGVRMIGFLVFVCVVVLVLINVPIAVALCIASVAAMLATQGVASLPNVPLALYQGATSFPLIAIPLFILAAAIMNTSGISHRLIDFCQALVGWMRGALAQVNVLSHMFFAEISGSAVAGVAATASIIMPAMKKRGYPGPFTAAVTSSTATLAIIIPPSIPMILYAVMAGTSVVQMFVAGIVPGLLAAFGFMGLCYWYAVRFNWPVEQIFEWGKLWSAFKYAFWALTLPVIILGGIFGGLVTATEGAALAVVAALLVGGLVYRELNWARLREAIIDGTVQTGTVMLLVAASALLGLYLTEVQLPQRIAAAMLSITSEKWAILAILNVFFLIIGMFLHSAAAIVLVVPIVMPAVIAAGIDPIHFGVIVTLNLAIGQQTPPVASVLLLTCSIAKESVWDVTKANIPFIGVLLATLLLITYVPVVTLGLVDLFYK